MKKLSFVALMLVASVFFACQKENINSTARNESEAVASMSVHIPDAFLSETSFNTFYGPEVQMGNGHARSWINVTHDNKALAIAVEMTSGALENLPQDPNDFEAATFVLPLHPTAKDLMPYDHITINWNVHGHEPPGLYDLPHFDFHFYKISIAEQLAIPPYEIAPALFDNEPPAGYIPPLYFKGPGGVPQMGAHWVDLLSPEFNGQIFTQTFIYGSYNGEVTFYEPMITMAVIQSGATIHKDIRQPLYFSPTNKYYATRYSIWKDETNNRHYMSLDEMVLR